MGPDIASLSASQSIVSALVGHLFPFAFLLVFGSVGLVFVVRAGRPANPVGRAIVHAALLVMVLGGGGGLGLAIWPSAAGWSAVVITPESIDCSPWRTAVRWQDVTALENFSQKRTSYGWKYAGEWLRLKERVEQSPSPLRAPSPSALTHIAEWIWREDPTTWANAPWPGPYRYCNLSDLTSPPAS